MLSVAAGPDPGDPVALPGGDVDYVALLETASVRGLKVAFSPDLGNPPVEAEVSAAVARAAQVFEQDLGAEVEQVEIELPDPFDYFVRYWGPQMIERGDLEATPDDDRPSPLGIARTVRTMTAVDYAQVQNAERARIHKAFADVFAEHDLLLTPTTPMVAFPHPGESGGPLEVAGKPSTHPVLESNRFTEAVAHAGFPAISIPCGFTSGGLPIGLQIAAGRWRDADLLRAAAAYEAAAPWAYARPGL